MVLLYFEYDEATIQNRMELLYPVEMLESQNGINNCSIMTTVIVLIFNPKIALDFLESQNNIRRNRDFVDIQSGLPKEELYDKVADLIIAHKIDRVIGW
jgi:alanine racemase